MFSCLIKWCIDVLVDMYVFSCMCLGITQAAIPSLVKKGIRGISVGVNNMTPPPAVPRLFMWQYANDSIMATWHPGTTGTCVLLFEISVTQFSML